MTQPFEDRVITISRVKSTVDYPADLMVVNLYLFYNCLVFNSLIMIEILNMVGM